MAELRTSIVIGARAQEALKALADVRRGLQEIVASANQGDASGGLGRTRAGVESISRELTRARQLLVAFQGAQALAGTVRQAFATADAYATLAARLKLATQGNEEYARAFAAIGRIADQNNAGLAETAQTYTRIAGTLRNLGASQADTLNLVEAVTLSLRISGATAEEAGSALLQFGQGLQSNFQGDEFRAITENAPRLLTAVAEGLKVPVEQLKSLSTQGKLTADVVAGSLVKSLEKLRAEAEGLPLTVGGAFQQLQNAAFRYVGSVDQARGTSVSAASAVKLLADNFKLVADALTVIAGIVAAGAIGRLVAAVAGLSAAGGGAAAVFGRLLALLGGPVGMGAALASVAGGFALFGGEARKALKPTEERVAELRKEIAELKKELNLPGAKPAQKTRLEQLKDDRERALADAQAFTGEFDTGANAVASIDRAIEAEERALANLKREQAERDQLREVKSTRIREAPKSEKDALAGLKTRFTIDDEFEQQAKDISLTFAAQQERLARELDQAIEKGDKRAASRIRKDIDTATLRQAAGFAALRKAREKDLAGLEDPVRLPQLKQQYDAAVVLLRDRIEREKAALELGLRENAISIANYFEQRRIFADQESEAEVARLTKERDREAAHIAELQRRREKTQKGSAAREQFDEAIFASSQKVLQANTEIQIAQSKRLAEGRRLAFEQTEAERALADQLAEVRDRLLDLQGAAGGDAARERLTRQFRVLREQLTTAGNREGLAQVDKLIDTEAQLAELRRFEERFNATLARMATAEQSLNVRRQAGLLTEAQARQELLQLYRDTGAEVEGLIAPMEALARAVGNPESVNRVAQMKNRVLELQSAVDQVAVEINGAVRDSFQGLFEDIARGAKSAKDIMLDFVRSVEQAISRIAARELADSLFGGGAKDGGIGGIIGGLFKRKSAAPAVAASFPLNEESLFGFLHTGGIVGAPTIRRAVSPLAFLGAPRFHLGGVLGLAPNEVPIVGKAGEEMLTEQDPRHRRNGGLAPGVTMIIQTPDAGSFRQSRSQIEADMGMAMARARRNL